MVYDLQIRYGGTFPLVLSLAEHLGHFEDNYVLISADEWKPGMLQDADNIVYAGLQQRKLPQALLEEIAAANQVLWFEDNIEQLAEVKAWRNFRLLGKVSDWTYINFKERSFYDWMSVEYTDPGKDVNVIATAKNLLMRCLLYGNAKMYITQACWSLMNNSMIIWDIYCIRCLNSTLMLRGQGLFCGSKM